MKTTQANKKKLHLSPFQAQILSIINRKAKAGVIRRELEIITGRTSGSVCGRTNELMKKDLVFESGFRVNKESGRGQKILFPVPF